MGAIMVLRHLCLVITGPNQAETNLFKDEMKAQFLMSEVGPRVNLAKNIVVVIRINFITCQFF